MQTTNIRKLLVFSACALAIIAAFSLAGCNSGSGSGGGRQFISLGTAPVGGAFFPVGSAIGEVLNEFAGDNNWKVTAKATKGTRENIRRLEKGDLQLALANSSITYHAVRGKMDKEATYEVRTVMTLAPNVGHFITLQGSGIQSLADLKGKRVVTGPAGAGFEFFLEPLLEAHGVSWDDITPLNNTQSAAVDMLGDGSADAVFLGGAMPQPSITQACASLDVAFIPFDAAAQQQLVDEYPFFHHINVPASMYGDLDEDFAGLNVGSMHLITHANTDEELVYQMTKTLWEQRAEVVKKHGVGKAINEGNAPRYTGTDFHPGAMRFYQEIGIWPQTVTAEPAGANSTSAAGEPDDDNPQDASPE